MDLLSEMREKILLISDPNSDYTQEDFYREYGSPFQESNYGSFDFKLNFSNKSNNQDPEYATEGSSGFDLRAYTEEPVIIKAGKRAVIPTGLFFELPQSFEMQIRPRSGLAAKNGITVLNTPGTIDNDYRGEIKVILINLGEEDFTIQNGDRIAQAVLAPVYGKNIINFVKISEVSTDTKRSDGGFGSTGLN